MITLREAVQLIPSRNGKKIHYNTIRRWILKGVHGNKLRAVKYGNQFFTKEEWIEDFQEKCTNQSIDYPAPVIELKSNKASESAHKRLEERYGWSKKTRTKNVV